MTVLSRWVAAVCLRSIAFVLLGRGRFWCETGGEASVDRLWRQFQISRATLYRRFEPEGGRWRHVQNQRLNQAFQRLTLPDAGPIRMVDMAVDDKFASNTTFVRAFRRRFGLTPGEVRRLSDAGRKSQSANGSTIPDSFALLMNFARL